MDIFVEVSIMSLYLELPRRLHLENVLHVFGYFKKNHNADMVSDLNETSVAQNNSNVKTGIQAFMERSN